VSALERAVCAISLLIARVSLPLMIALGAWLVPARQLRLGADAELKEAIALLFFALVMGTFGYACLRDAHVRIDVASRSFSARVRAALELAGCIAILLPVCGVLAWYGGDAAWRSFEQGERLAAGDLPLQWLVRLMVPVGALLLAAAAICVAARAVRALRGPRSADP